MNKKRLTALLLSGVMMLSLASCGPKEESKNPSEPLTITKTAQGYGGEVSVTLTFTDGAITDVVLAGDKETPAVGGAALETLKTQLLEAGSAEIDGVSGATVTSSAVKSAAAAAIAESGNTIDWLISHGFDYGEGTTEGQGWGFGGPQPGFTPRDKFCVKFQYTGQGYGNWKKETGEMFDSIMEDYVELGGKYLLEIEATELIYDEATNTVTGVKAVGYDGTEYTINAKVVITATGGFSNNAELQEEYLSNEYYPLKGSWLMYGMTQNDGKIIDSALSIGAGTYNIGMPPMVHLQGSPVTLHEYPVEIVGDENDVGFWSRLPRRNSLNDFPNALAGATYGLQVNMDGERFSNEAGTFQTWKSGPKYYTIWSDDFFQSVKTNGLPVSFSDDLTCQGGIDGGKPIDEVYDVIDLCIEKGIAYKADTLEELANVLGCDPAVLTDNVSRYNAAVDSGVDEEFGKDASNLTMKIGETGPYYAFVGASFIYSTVGGLDVNTSMQVLGSDNATPINGLYSVGTDSLGVLFSERREYVTYGGAAQGWAYTSGRLAGLAAVESLQQ